MTGWITRRINKAIDRHADTVLHALADGAAHYIVGDLDKATGIAAARLYAPLARLETTGRVESGWADVGPDRPRRRWYRIKDMP